jgi:hypothetical protein
VWVDGSDRIRELYRTAPEEFVAARDELAKALKAEGADADAAAVKKAQSARPVAAWALNQLADRDPKGIEELERAGAALRGSMSARGADALREATATRRSIVTRLARTAADILREADRSPDTHRDEVAATLEAASVDETVGEQLRTGTLERTVSNAVGFGEVGGLHLVATLEQDEPPEQARARGRGRPPRGARPPEEGRRRRRPRCREGRGRDGTPAGPGREGRGAARRRARRPARGRGRRPGATLEARRAATDLERAERRSR